ncbi:xyloglucan fucosyltransferase [Marchantia polymorpha subsp. ruderalis]|uniref:Fucosyltransferase n=2 Tax=Marchantia polymorpha TaxID=3197 RepID=A0AAF6BYC3_MARPO|nr:hypothetical protein MARPO_0003s0134 [Marchantia polymorpha]BBN17007.1 hypothetical protein Mp_7g11200 [Marchantia polymorpha subsp. ruderalis]|eukprot:PTQ49244.1 hypothetical protein MARPO_0003s0134 [Marchantia polymorpha]
MEKAWWRSRMWTATATAVVILLPSFALLGYMESEHALLSQTSSVLEGIVSSSYGYAAGALPTSGGGATAVGPVQDLIARLRERTRLALASSADEPYSEEEQQIWAVRNPCVARDALPARYKRRTFAQDPAPNAAWARVFHEYSNLHRACTRRIGNLSRAFYSDASDAVPPGCQFVIGESYTGLGNKMLVLASTLMYAVLTGRVLLAPANTLIPAVFCEPFEGSSWRVDDDGMTNLKAGGPWTEVAGSFGWVDEQAAENVSRLLTRVKVHNGWQPVNRFYCDSEQAFLSQVPWMQIGACLHFLPRLFAVPKFRPVMEALFPDRMALTHLLRSALLPSDAVWERVLNVDEVYLEHTERQIGVQVRYFDQRIRDRINSRVGDCCLENDLLPAVQPFPSPAAATNANQSAPTTANVRTARSGHQHSRITKVFIASLLPDVHDYLNQRYLRQRTVGEVAVGLVQLTHESSQRTGVEVDSEALVEMLCLSFSDHLLVTPQSTFGGVAQAYGALKPWFINYDRDPSIPPSVNCQRGQSVDVCYQGGPRGYDCKHDPGLKGHNLFDDLPYLQPCLGIDTSGIQIITSHDSL